MKFCDHTEARAYFSVRRRTVKDIGIYIYIYIYIYIGISASF